MPGCHLCCEADQLTCNVGAAAQMVKFALKTGIPAALVVPVCLQRASKEESTDRRTVRRMDTLARNFPDAPPMQAVMLKFGTHGLAKTMLGYSSLSAGILSQMEAAAIADMQQRRAEVRPWPANMVDRVEKRMYCMASIL